MTFGSLSGKIIYEDFFYFFVNLLKTELKNDSSFF